MTVIDYSELRALAYEEWIERDGGVITAQNALPVLLDRIEAVLALHKPKEGPDYAYCTHCDTRDEAGGAVGWTYPCPTVLALGLTKEESHG